MVRAVGKKKHTQACYGEAVNAKSKEEEVRQVKSKTPLHL